MIDLSELAIGPRKFPDARRRALADLRFEHLALRPLSPVIGAEVSSLDLREPPSDSVVAELERALEAWKVPFAINDYWPQPRLMDRVSIVGDRPR